MYLLSKAIWWEIKVWAIYEIIRILLVSELMVHWNYRVLLKLIRLEWLWAMILLPIKY